VEHATRQDYEGFFAREIAFRSELGYPPFSRLVNIVSQDENAQTAEERAERMAEILRRVAPSEADVLGPALAPIPRLRNQERRHVILRAPLSVPISEIVRRALDELPSAERRGLVVDVDPASLM
jgi:primosomal protein N' (replication factor Y)